MNNKRLKIGLITLVFLFLVSCSTLPPTTNTAGYDALAQCLAEKGAIMYGAEWCGHCQNQKAMFGDSFQYINYIDCDKNREACVDAGIRGYPTWVIDGKSYPGEQSLATLSGLAVCDV